MNIILNSLIVAAVTSAGFLAFQTQPADAYHYGGRNLGGVNLNAYCKRYHGGQSRAIVVENHAGGWRCGDNAGNEFGISVQKACEDTYRHRPIKAFTVGNEPGDWRCRWARRHP